MDNKPKFKTPRGASATAAKNKYRDTNYDRIELTVPAGNKAKIQIHAKSMGESTTSFINRAINETIERDQERK